MSRCSIVVSILPVMQVTRVRSPATAILILFCGSFNGGQRRTCHAGSLGSIPNNGSLTKVGTGLLFLKYGL